jgi:hypothetical protein
VEHFGIKSRKPLILPENPWFAAFVPMEHTGFELASKVPQIQ